MNKFLAKIAGVALGLAMAIGVGVSVSSGDARGAKAAEAAYATCDFTTKSYFPSSSGYTGNWDYGDYTVIHGNNNGTTNSHNNAWALMKFGPKKSKSGDSAKVDDGYIQTGKLSASITKIGLQIAASTVGDGGTNSSVTWGVTVYSDSKFETQIASVSLAALTYKTAGTYTLIPSSGTSWAVDSYYKIQLHCTNDTTTNGLICVEKLIFYYDDTPAKTLSSITLGGTYSTTFTQGDAFNHTGMIVTANYSDNTTADVTSSATWSSPDMTTTGNKTVTVSYTEGTTKTAVYTITVNAAATESIAVTGTNTMYVEDAAISLTATPSNFTPTSYTWNSSDTSVATVSGTGTTGTVSAVAKGTTNITASATGTNGTVVSNSFTLTVKQFSISLSSDSVLMKASKSTTVTVTPTDANGTVVVTATSGNADVATTSVSGTTITITSGSTKGVSTTITVSAKDNNGATGYHTAANQTIAVSIDAGYQYVKLESIPSEETEIVLFSGTYYVEDGKKTGTSDDESARVFTLIPNTDGTTCKIKNSGSNPATYVTNGGGNTTVTIANSSSCDWYMRTDNSYKGTLQLSNNSGRFLAYASANSGAELKAYDWSNKDSSSYPKVYAYKRVAIVPEVSLNGSSVSGLKGNSDTTLTLAISNFTASGLNVTYQDSGESSFSSSSSIASVTCGYTTGNNTVSVSFIGVGSTTVKLTVTRESGSSFEKTFTVTVAAKPASIVVSGNGISNGVLEIQTGASKTFSKTHVAVEDTDGNAYSISSIADIKITSSDTSIVGRTGDGTLNGVAVGTAIVTFAVKDLETVSTSITVNVVDDYRTTVNTITFNTTIAGAEQGDTVDIDDVITSKTANTHFGATSGTILTILDSELMFSYSDDRDDALAYNEFIYDFDNGHAISTPSETEEVQKIYVYTTFDSTYKGSFEITVAQKNDPLTAITITNTEVVSSKVNLTRGDTLQLTWALTPTNPTDGRAVKFTASTTTSGVDVTVSNTGLISVSSSSALGDATVRIEAAHDSSIYADVTVTVKLEAMDYTVSIPETQTSSTTVQVGDKVYMVANNGTETYELSGLSETSTVYGIGEEYSTNVSKLQLLTVVAGSSNGTFAFQMSDGNYLNWSSGNSLTSDSTLNANSSWTVNGTTITNAADTTRQLWWNNINPRFACYTNKEDTDGYYCPTFVKVSGGDETKDVTEALFNAIYNNFGEGKTYGWNPSCENFASDKWATACGAITGLENYSAYKLNRAVADSTGNEIEQFLAKYDIVISKVGAEYDYLGRFTTGGINASVKINRPTTTLFGDNSGTVAIIAVISMLSLASIGGFFFLRKRKEY